MEGSNKKSLKLFLIIEVLLVLTIVFFIIKKRYNAVKYPEKKVLIVSKECFQNKKEGNYITILYENKKYDIALSKLNQCNKFIVKDSIKAIYSKDLDEFSLK